MKPLVDFPVDWRDGLIQWAQRTDAVAELWLFGSHAKGTARPDSDVDIALVPMPPRGIDDWAIRDYLALAIQWRHELERIVCRRVSLTAIVPETPGDKEVRTTGFLLWSRPR